MKDRSRIVYFIFMLMLRKFRALICISKINTWHVDIRHYIIYHLLELELKVLKKANEYLSRLQLMDKLTFNLHVR